MAIKWDVLIFKARIMLTFQEIYSNETNQLLAEHASLIERVIPHVVEDFYAELLKHEKSRAFLDESEVQNRLKASQAQWLRSVLRPHSPEEEDAFKTQQIHIGHVHARIDLPMQLMNQGIRLHKRAFLHHLFEYIDHAETGFMLFLALSDILDYSAMLINDAYMQYEQELEHETQAFTIAYSSSDLAFETLSIKSSLQSWLIELLTLTDGHACQDRLSCIEETEFWLWIEHRLAQLSSNFPSIQLVTDAQQQLMAFIRSQPCLNQPDWRDTLKKHINKLANSLQLFSEEVMDDNQNRDPLTQLLNRRLLDGILKKEHQVARTHEGDYALMLIDVDHFKQINDSYGHAVGDAVLKEVATLIRQHLRITDLAFRYGGEEFLVLLPLSKGADVVAIAEKLRKTIEQNTELSSEHKDLKVTVSIGVSQYSRHPHPDYIHVLKQADAALYEAKRQGRNRVVVYEGALI